MRYWTFLLIATIALLAPANLYAQVENATPTGKPAPTKPAEQTNPCASAKDYKVIAARNGFVYYYKIGQTLQVRLNNQVERVGKLSETQSDYFLLVSSKGAEKIAYTDIASVKVKKSFWQHVGSVLLLPIKAPVYAVVYAGFYTLVGVGHFVDWITGHTSESWQVSVNAPG